MKAYKESELEKCHSDFLSICFGDFPMEKIPRHVSSTITGFGTNVNEKIQSFSDFINLLEFQRKESEDIAMKFHFDPAFKTVFSNGKAAVFVDEGKIAIKVDGSELELFLRLYSVYEFFAGKWVALHFHGSLPQGEEGDQDTWAVNEWKRKNEELQQIIQEKTKDLEHSLEELKSTQAQLIQSEKMASLGELTSGIAHEIKNPLNFVNNFSEVSKELLEEMIEELKNGNYDLVAETAEEVNQNLEKILHHGKRADGIVKGMLQHSRSNSRKKEAVALNNFIDEFLRLAYHGLKAKDKSFNARMETRFDPEVVEIMAAPQELGRVILNLFTNAFYAVNEKKKKTDEAYEPTVWISTHKNKSGVIIKIRDNGLGIPKNLLDKIFQPFFTTKPTGQGTGLGLSLSYDIIKSHGGELKVESEGGEGSQFMISLPIEVKNL